MSATSKHTVFDRDTSDWHAHRPTLHPQGGKYPIQRWPSILDLSFPPFCNNLRIHGKHSGHRFVDLAKSGSLILSRPISTREKAMSKPRRTPQGRCWATCCSTIYRNARWRTSCRIPYQHPDPGNSGHMPQTPEKEHRPPVLSTGGTAPRSTRSQMRCLADRNARWNWCITGVGTW